MKKSKYSFLCLLATFAAAILLMAGCDIKKNKDVKPQTEFLKIYDNQSFSDTYLPLDIKQTSDEGYIILAKTRISDSPFYGIYLMKTDKEGKFISEKLLPSTQVSPASGLMQVGQEFFFFCMDGTTLASTLVKVDESINPTVVQSLSGLIYPLYATQENSGNFILQSYNRDDKKTVVSLVNTSGSIVNTAEYDIGVGDFDVEEPIMDHLTGTGKTLPFLAGTLENGTYFFNGFYNYTLSMVFFSFGSTATPGVLQGYKDERCVSSALYVQDISKFALSGYTYGNNTIYPSVTVNYGSGAVASSYNLPGFPIPEFNPDARIILKKETIKGRSTLVYGSDTRSGQIALYFYDAATGNFIASKHLGYSNTFLFGNVIKTKDEGFAIAGTTYLSGRFSRLCLYKLQKEDIETLIP